MIYFDHPYPRYGLASALYHADIRSVTPETIPEEMELAKLAANFISDALYKYQLHTDDKPLAVLCLSL